MTMSEFFKAVSQYFWASSADAGGNTGYSSAVGGVADSI